MSTEVLQELLEQEAVAWNELKFAEAKVTIARGEWEIRSGKAELYRLHMAEDVKAKDEK